MKFDQFTSGAVINCMTTNTVSIVAKLTNHKSQINLKRFQNWFIIK